MTAAEIQTRILNETGLKTSVKAFKTGSMRGYVRIMPMYQGGEYPSFPFDFIQALKNDLSEFDYANKPLLCTCSDICVYGMIDDSVLMKKESKPKNKEQIPVKGWGSKNSQMRLDKAAARNAKKMQKGNTARYW